MIENVLQIKSARMATEAFQVLRVQYISFTATSSIWQIRVSKRYRSNNEFQTKRSRAPAAAATPT